MAEPCNGSTNYLEYSTYQVLEKRKKFAVRVKGPYGRQKKLDARNCRNQIARSGIEKLLNSNRPIL